MPEKNKLARKGLVSMDLQHFKPLWLKWCASVGKTPSEGFRDLVAYLKPGQMPSVARRPTTSPIVPVRSEPVSVRVWVSLTQSESAAVRILAKQDRITPPRWIAALVRAYITNRPQLNPSSTEALRESTFQLRAVGKNLNQIARALNSIVDHLDHGRLQQANEAVRAQSPEQLRQLIAEVHTVIQGHVPKVVAVLDENVGRWQRRAKKESKD